MSNKPDPMEFVIPASDGNGHSARFWFRGIPQMSRQIDQMVYGRKFPYRTKGDLLRHAVHRHLKWLREQGQVTGISTQVDLITDVLRDEELNVDFLSVFDKLAQQISNHISRGDNGEAVRLIRIVQDHIGGMPDGYWKDRYVKELEVKFGHLITNGAKANLGVIE